MGRLGPLIRAATATSPLHALTADVVPARPPAIVAVKVTRDLHH
jgi:hypothetical protein